MGQPNLVGIGIRDACGTRQTVVEDSGQSPYHAFVFDLGVGAMQIQ